MKKSKTEITKTEIKDGKLVAPGSLIDIECPQQPLSMPWEHGKSPLQKWAEEHEDLPKEKAERLGRYK